MMYTCCFLHPFVALSSKRIKSVETSHFASSILELNRSEIRRDPLHTLPIRDLKGEGEILEKEREKEARRFFYLSFCFP